MTQETAKKQLQALGNPILREVNQQAKTRGEKHEARRELGRLMHRADHHKVLT